MNDRPRPFWIAFALCAAAAAAPFLVTYRMPMTDLPQHAAQITIWKHYNDPCYGFARTYRKDWFTPYLLGYGVARAFSTFLSVNDALKLTVYLTVLALALAVRMLALRAGLDPFLSLLAFPLAFGFSFYWGFLNFIVALPLGIAFVAWAYDYSLQQTVRRALIVAAAGLLLLIAHALVFAACLAIAGAMHLTLWRNPKRMLLTAIPYALPLPLVALWALHVRRAEAPAQIAPWWREIFARPLLFPMRLLANDRDSAATGFALLFMIIVAVSGVAIARERRRWIPFVVAAACYLFIPYAAFGNAWLFPRFAILAAVFALFALEAGKPLVPRPWGRALLLAAVFAWFAILSARFYRFGADARDFDRIANAIPTNRRLMFLNLIPGSDAVPGAPFLHFAAYDQERRGGVIASSFASHFPELIRYRPGADPMTSFGIEWDPRAFNWQSNDSRFDFFLVRAPLDMHDAIFRQATEPVDLRGHVGLWWLFAKRSAAPGDACAPFEPDDGEARRESR